MAKAKRATARERALRAPDEAEGTDNDEARAERREKELAREREGIRAQYERLALEIADRTGGRGKGWQKRAAEHLGVTQGFLSKVLSGQYVGEDSLRRATVRVGVGMDYFGDFDADPGDHIEVDLKPPPTKTKVPTAEEDPPLDSLARAHRTLLRAFEALVKGEGEQAERTLETLREVAFVRAIESGATGPALLMPVLFELAQFVQWIRDHPQEPTMRTSRRKET